MSEVAVRWEGPCWRYTRNAKAIALFFWMAVFGASETQAAAQSTLDLVCSSQSGSPIRFRFDFEQRKWCFAECQAVWQIDELGDARIKLSVRTKDDSDYWSINIDRYASEFWIVRRGYGTDPSDWGRCEPQPFSGFPQQQF